MNRSLAEHDATAVRYRFVDALRGVAAGLVLIHHLVPWGFRHAKGPLGQVLDSVAEFGNQGVTVFFVISGFVIAHSLRNALISPAYFANFVLRRSVRLDPPYWVAIAVTMTMLGCSTLLPGKWVASVFEFPSAGTVLAHLTYTQYILGCPELLFVSWTLCLEMQFYLAFVGLLWLSQRLEGVRDIRDAIPWRTIGIFIAPLAIIGVACSVELLNPLLRPFHSPERAWFVSRFYLFLFGAITAWAVLLPRLRAVFWMLAAAFAIRIALSPAEPTNTVALLTALAIYIFASRPRLNARSHFPISEFLGRISYSLYLIHVPIGYTVRALVRAIDRNSLPIQDLSIILAIAASVIAAYVMHRVIEVRTVALSRRLRFRGESPMPAQVDKNGGSSLRMAA